MLGGALDRPTYRVDIFDNTYSRSFNTNVNNYRVTLKNVDGKTYQHVCGNFAGSMKNILEDVLSDARPDDLVRFHIRSSKFNGDDINTKFQPRSQIADDYVAAFIDKTMQSHNTINMNDDFELIVMHVRIPVGLGLKRMLNPNMLENLQRRCTITGIKKLITKEEDRDVQIPCFVYALAIAMKLKTQNYAHVNNWSRCRTMVRRECMRLHREAGVPVGDVTVHQYTFFQQQLLPGYRLVIVNALHSKSLLYKGDSLDVLICLLYYNNHYYPLKSLNTWFTPTYYCVDCEKGTSSKMLTCVPKIVFVINVKHAIV